MSSSKQNLLSLNHDHLAGKITRSTRWYNVSNTYTIRMPCAEIMDMKRWGGGYGHVRISLSSSGRRRRPTSSLLLCSGLGLNRCFCFLLLSRSNPFGLPDWSTSGVSYAGRRSDTRWTLRREVTHLAHSASESRVPSYRYQAHPRSRSTE